MGQVDKVRMRERERERERESEYNQLKILIRRSDEKFLISQTNLSLISDELHKSNNKIRSIPPITHLNCMLLTRSLLNQCLLETKY